jgi:hypothetical protein
MSNKSVSEIALDDRTEIRKTLLSLLKNNRDNFHIEFEGFLSNHLSHALTALYHLGGKFGCQSNTYFSATNHDWYNLFSSCEQATGIL